MYTNGNLIYSRKLSEKFNQKYFLELNDLVLELNSEIV